MSHVQSQLQWRPECAICKESVTLEESKADENGQATHEDCYVSRDGKSRHGSLIVFDPALSCTVESWNTQWQPVFRRFLRIASVSWCRQRAVSWCAETAN
jgi:hypothetical protein